MNEVVIEKGIPIPTGRSRSTDELPFSRMEIGDSFFILIPEGRDPGSFSAAYRTRAIAWGKKNGTKFLVRLVDGHKGVRVWRTE